MVDPRKHSRADAIRIAEVAGGVQNLAGKLRREEMTLAECVAELHAITPDQHLLAHGANAAYGDPATWPADALGIRLALAAGVDPAEAAAIHAEMHPPGQRGLRLGRGE